MDRLHRGVFGTRSGRFVQRTELTALQHAYLKAMQVAPRIEAKARRTASAKATASAGGARRASGCSHTREFRNMVDSSILVRLVAQSRVTTRVEEWQRSVSDFSDQEPGGEDGRAGRPGGSVGLCLSVHRLDARIMPPSREHILDIDIARRPGKRASGCIDGRLVDVSAHYGGRSPQIRVRRQGHRQVMGDRGLTLAMSSGRLDSV